MLRVDAIWSGANVVGGGITQFYFNNNSTEAEACSDAVDDTLTALLVFSSNLVAVGIDPIVAELDAETGALIGFHPVTPLASRVGGISTPVLPPSNQGLIRLTTGNVENGRLVRGRIFIPGPCEINSTLAGAPEASYITGANAAAQLLVDDASAAWVVWHRPVSGSGGSMNGVTSVSTWNKWAVLRSRRD